MTPDQAHEGLDAPPEQGLQKPANSEVLASYTPSNVSRETTEGSNAQNPSAESPEFGSTIPAVRPGSTIEVPDEGTLAWLQLQEHVEVEGLGWIPAIHRMQLDQGGSIYLGEENDGDCRYIRPDGRRCRAVRTRVYGICIVHSGGGGADMQAMAKLGGQAKQKLKLRRQLLGIGPKEVATPRSLLRLAALERAEDLALAALEPLDDHSLSSVARHGAALRVMDAAFPLQQVTVDVELPSSAADVEQLGWQDMQRMAAHLLGEGAAPALHQALASPVVEPDEE